MALLDINWHPSRKELRVFAALQWIFLCVVAWLLLPRGGGSTLPLLVMAVATTACILGLLWPGLLRPLYVAWMTAVLPIAWAISHALMALVYYLVITPIGLVLRLVGYDPLDRKWDSKATSYWKRRSADTDVKRYFRPF